MSGVLGVRAGADAAWCRNRQMLARRRGPEPIYMCIYIHTHIGAGGCWRVVSSPRGTDRPGGGSWRQRRFNKRWRGRRQVAVYPWDARRAGRRRRRRRRRRGRRRRRRRGSWGVIEGAGVRNLIRLSPSGVCHFVGVETKRAVGSDRHVSQTRCPHREMTLILKSQRTKRCSRT